MTTRMDPETRRNEGGNTAYVYIHRWKVIMQFVVVAAAVTVIKVAEAHSLL